MQGFGDWMTEDDLLIDLPGVVWINNYPFVLLETDKVLFCFSLFRPSFRPSCALLLPFNPFFFSLSHLCAAL